MGLCLDKNESFITPEAESSASIDKESYGGSNSHEVPFETNSNVSMPRIDSALVDESHVPEAALNTSDISKEHAKVVPPKEHGKRCESDHIGDANFREGSKTKDTLSLENGNGEIGAVALDQFVSVKAKSRKGCRISKDTTASDTKDTKEESIVSPGPAELSESRDNYEPDGIPSREPQGPGNSIRITVEKEGHRRQPPVRGERCENRCPHFHVLEHEWCTDNSTCKKLHKAKNEKFFPKFVDVPKPLPLRWFGLKDLNAIESRPDIKKRCGDLEYQEEFLVNSDVWIDKDRKFDKIREFMGKSRPDYKSNTKGNDPGHIYVFKLGTLLAPLRCQSVDVRASPYY
ncbi:hypothetical protein EDD21DRAFT_174218 [Dissophora ornata]|nr:hypothetical protein EDD21DRAFT_174218 [Dissophora ornata]